MKFAVPVCFLLLSLASTQAVELFHLPHPSGNYHMVYWEARDLCKSAGASLAMKAELEEARRAGFSVCKCGWVLEEEAYFPMTSVKEECGGKAALHKCDWAEKWDAYCFRGDSALNCSKPLGMETSEIADSQLLASSENKYWFPFWSPSRWTAQLARLRNTALVNAWMPQINGRHQWIGVDLEVPTAITGIITQGASRLGKKYWVTRYTVAYSKDGHNYKKVKINEEDMVFTGNSDNNGYARSIFPEPILTRYIRIYPYEWHINIALRFELLGCDMETYNLAVALGREMSVINVSPGNQGREPIFIEREPDEPRDEASERQPLE